MRNLFVSGVFFLTWISISCSHREHKVHNIVLYPDKQSWCKTTPIKQVVGEAGYGSTTVENSVCVGTCFSYSIPHTSDTTITPYCDSCQPSETHWFHVTLTKEANADEELSEYRNQETDTPLPDKIQKHVQIITNCTCSACSEQLNKKHMDLHNTTELPNNFLADYKSNGSRPILEATSTLPTNPIRVSASSNGASSPFEVPELLHLVNMSSHLKTVRNNDLFDKSKNEQFQNVSDAQKYLLNTRLINLLKNIQNSSQKDSTPTENNFNFDRDLLNELLHIIEGSEDSLNDKNLMEFVNFVNVHNSEDFELDLMPLKLVLTRYENERKVERTTPGTREALEYLHVKSESEINRKHSNHHHDENHHRGHHHQHHHHHYSGEHVNLPDSSEGKLVYGPHGSLVVQPDHYVEKKLTIAPHLLKPNTEGTIIHYEGYVNNDNNHDDKTTLNDL